MKQYIFKISPIEHCVQFHSKIKAVIAPFFLLFLLLIFSSCRYSNHEVKISPYSAEIRQDIFLESSKKEVSLRFIDSREYKNFIGFRTRASVWRQKDKYKDSYYFEKEGGFQLKVAKISNNNHFVDIFGRKFTNNFYDKNLQIKDFSFNHMSVEIMEVSVVSSMYRNVVNSKIKVNIETRSGLHSKIYEQEFVSHKPMILAIILGPFDFGMGSGHYDWLVDKCLDKNIAQIMQDNDIWGRL